MPSYQHCLWLIGQYLNQQHARAVAVAEIDTGFMVLLFPDGQYGKQQVLMVSYADLLDLTGDFAQAAHGRKGGRLRGGTNHDKKHPLVPQGYETVFRAIGIKLDQRQATCITLCENTDALFLDYWVSKATFVVRDQRRQAVSHHQMERYDAVGIRSMQDTVRLTLEQEASRYMGALRLNPHDHISAMHAALSLEDSGDYDEAEKIFRQVLSAVPDHAEAQYHYARLAYIRGDKRTALQAIRKSLALRSDIAGIHNLYGRILRQHRKTAEAVAAFEEAAALEADNFHHYYHLAQAYEAMGRADEAAQALALVSQPHAAPAWDLVAEQLLGEPFVAATDSRVVAAIPAESVQPSAVNAALPAVEEAAPESPFEMTELFDSSRDTPLTETIIPRTPVLTTSFDSFESSPWAQPESQLPTLDTAAQFVQPVAPDSSWGSLAEATSFDSIPQLAPATLSERLRGAIPHGAGPLAARTPQEVESVEVVALPTMDPEAAVLTPNPATFESFDLQPAVPIHIATPPVSPPPVPTIEAAATSTSPNAVEIAAEILTIERALDAEPNRADLHRKLGFLLARQGRAAEAAAEFRKALQCSRMSL